MCGLIGVIGLSKLKTVGTYSIKRPLLEHLMILSSFRGLDSTGWFAVDAKSNIKVDKKVLTPWDYVNSLYWDRKVSNTVYSTDIFIGHTRKATVGGIDLATAHPFDEEYVVGVHNGTLSVWKDLVQSDCISDSQAIFKKFSETDAKDNTTVLEQLDGAYALIWFDKQEQKLFLTRNKERPLWLGETKEGAVVVASERQNIQFSTERLGVEVVKYTELPEGELWSVALQDIKKDIEFTKEKYTPYTKPETKVFSYTDYFKSKFVDNYDDIYTPEEEEIFTTFKVKPNRSFGFKFSSFNPFNTGTYHGKQHGTLYGVAFNKVSKTTKTPIAVIINGIDINHLLSEAAKKFKDVFTVKDLERIVFSAKPGFAYYHNKDKNKPILTAYPNTVDIMSIMKDNKEVTDESQVH